MSDINPPKILYYLVNLFSRSEVTDRILDDFEEEYEQIFYEKGKKSADSWYRKQAIKSIPRFIKFSIYWGIVMLKNYFKLTVRNFLRNPVHSAINVGGLALALAICIIILLFVQNEYSYDNFHTNADRIYRIININEKNSQTFSGTPAPLAPLLKANFEQIENYVRIGKGVGMLKVGDREFFEERLFIADNSIFDVFSFKMLFGDSKTALSDKNSIVVSATMAKKYFGDSEALGKTLTLDGKDQFKVTGVFEDIQKNSHIHFDFLTSFERCKNLNRWGNWNYYTYLLFDAQTSPMDFKNQMLAWAEETGINGGKMYNNMNFQELKKIHFEYDRNNLEPSINEIYLDVFMAVAFVVLIIACINFMNLSTAKSAHRAKEVGLRKVSGAFRNQIMFQFLGESVILAFISNLLAIGLTLLFVPVFNTITEKTLTLNIFDPKLLIGLLILGLFTGLVSGSYPAFILSSYKPTKVLKGRFSTKNFSSFRNILVVFQFSASISLIISTLLINSQLEFMQKKNLGINKENVINISLPKNDLINKLELLKTEFMKLNSVTNASAHTYKPGDATRMHGIYWDSKTKDDVQSMFIHFVDKDFISTMQIDMLEGGERLKEFSGNNSEYAYILNEAAVDALGWESAINNRFSAMGKDTPGYVLGVMKNFNFRSLHHEMAPLVFLVADKWMNNISLRISSDNLPETINEIKSKWDELSGGQDFKYSFMDEGFDKLYKAEKISGDIGSIFTIFSIIIACMGLFGLASYTAEQRTKEIGIRKTLGASIYKILGLLFNEIFLLVIIANVIAWPVAYYFASEWLTNFAFKVEINILLFVYSAFLVFLFAIISVAYRVFEVAKANPIDALKYE